MTNAAFNVFLLVMQVMTFAAAAAMTAAWLILRPQDDGCWRIAIVLWLVLAALGAFYRKEEA